MACVAMRQPASCGLVGERQELLVVHPQHAARVGVPVRDAERRRRAAQAAVGEELDRVDAEATGHMAALRAAALARRRRSIAAP